MTRTEIFNELKDILIAEDERNRDVIASCTEETELVEGLGLNSVGIM